MNFLNQIKSSFYNQTYYSLVKEQSLSKSFRYFFSLVAVLSIAVAFIIGIELSGYVTSENMRKIIDHYPKDLVIKIEKGVVSTNVVEPYFIKTPDGLKQSESHGNIFVIDTKNDFSLDLFKKYDTQFLLGKNYIVNFKKQGTFELNDLSKSPDFILSYDRLSHWVDLIVGEHIFIAIGIFFLLFIAFFGFFTTELISAVILSFIVFLLFKLQKNPLTFANCYKVLLHAVTLSLILETLLIVTGYNLNIPFFYSFLTLIIVFINIERRDNSIKTTI